MSNQPERSPWPRTRSASRSNRCRRWPRFREIGQRLHRSGEWPGTVSQRRPRGGERPAHGRCLRTPRAWTSRAKRAECHMRMDEGGSTFGRPRLARERVAGLGAVTDADGVGETPPPRSNSPGLDGAPVREAGRHAGASPISSRAPSARSTSWPRSISPGGALVAVVIALALATAASVIAPDLRGRLFSPSLDLVLDTVTTVVTLAVAVLAWLRFRERAALVSAHVWSPD